MKHTMDYNSHSKRLCTHNTNRSTCSETVASYDTEEKAQGLHTQSLWLYNPLKTFNSSKKSTL